MRSGVVATIAVLVAFAGNAGTARTTPLVTDGNVKVTQTAERVCDRWSHKAPEIRASDLIRFTVINVDRRPAKATPLGSDGNRYYGYGSDVTFTVWAPSKRSGRPTLRFASMDGRCHRVVLRYTVTRYAAGESPYG